MAFGPRSHHWEGILQSEVVPPRRVDVANKGQRAPSWVCACPKEAAGLSGLGPSVPGGWATPLLLAKAAPMDNL